MKKRLNAESDFANDYQVNVNNLITSDEDEINSNCSTGYDASDETTNYSNKISLTSSRYSKIGCSPITLKATLANIAAHYCTPKKVVSGSVLAIIYINGHRIFIKRKNFWSFYSDNNTLQYCLALHYFV